MKTLLRAYIVKLKARLAVLEREKEYAAKLDYNTECSSISSRINDCKNVIDDLNKILKD